MDSTRDLSVGELLDQLLADSLIDACHITGDNVTIVQGTKRHSFPYGQARTFLMGMLRGRSWNLKASEPEGDYGLPPLRAIEKRREEAIAALAGTDTDVTETYSEPQRPASASRQYVRALGSALDELLVMAVDMDLIESSSINEVDQTVTIVLSACQTQMQYDEAVVFVTECILYKLNAMRDDVRKLSEEADTVDVGRRTDRPDEAPARARVAGDEPVWRPLV